MVCVQKEDFYVVAGVSLTTIKTLDTESVMEAALEDKLNVVDNALKVTSNVEITVAG